VVAFWNAPWRGTPRPPHRPERCQELGNGGLGRLAACFLDSLATLAAPRLRLRRPLRLRHLPPGNPDGYQVEEPDNWLRYGNPWEIERPESRFEVHFGGRVDMADPTAASSPAGSTTETVLGIPYDIPIPGYGNHTVNNLRLWEARPPRTST
jgi:glycogen phosphorylase